MNSLSKYRLRETQSALIELKNERLLPKWYHDLLFEEELENELSYKYEGCILHMVSFPQKLNTREALQKLKELNLIPADCYETALFYLQFKQRLRDFPVISLGAYPKTMGNVKPPLAIAITFLGFETPGGIEDSEAVLGIRFMEEIKFLVKKDI